MKLSPLITAYHIEYHMQEVSCYQFRCSVQGFIALAFSLIGWVSEYPKLGDWGNVRGGGGGGEVGSGEEEEEEEEDEEEKK